MTAKGDAYYLQHPRKQLFYKWNAILMSFLAMGHQRWFGYDPPKYKKFFFVNRTLTYICAPSVLTSQLTYIYLNYNDMTFNIRGIIFAFTPVTALVNLCVLSAQQTTYAIAMKKFIHKIHLHNLKGQSDYIDSQIVSAEKGTRWASYFTACFLVIDCLSWLSLTGFNNYKNKEAIHNKTMRLQTVIYTVWPFDYEYNFRNWMIVHCANVYLVWCGGVIIVTHNSMAYAFVFQLIGHIKILRHKLATQFKDIVEEGDVRRNLVDVIRYHSFVLGVFTDAQDGFGLIVAGNYAYNMIADSLLLYQMMMGENKGDLLIYGLMILVYLGTLIMLSFVLEEVRRQSENLSDLVYNIQWENMSDSNRKMLSLMLMRMQPALEFTAAGGLKAGVRPMISIVKSTFSYYVMLKQSMKT